jgi:hypothetical protein
VFTLAVGCIDRSTRHCPVLVGWRNQRQVRFASCGCGVRLWLWLRRLARRDAGAYNHWPVLRSLCSRHHRASPLCVQLPLDCFTRHSPHQGDDRCVLGLARRLQYPSISLSHVSLLLVGIRACKVMGESRFAGSLVFTIVTQHAHRR